MARKQLSLTPPPPITPDVERTPVSLFARKAYLDYSMYVDTADIRRDDLASVANFFAQRLSSLFTG